MKASTRLDTVGLPWFKFSSEATPPEVPSSEVRCPPADEPMATM
jgi:hypothetical protein